MEFFKFTTWADWQLIVDGISEIYVGTILTKLARKRLIGLNGSMKSESDLQLKFEIHWLAKTQEIIAVVVKVKILRIIFYLVC